MKAAGTFEVIAFEPTAVVPQPDITTALPVGISRMEKRYSGEVSGRSASLFTAAFDQGSGTGTYVAMESFDGSLHDLAGTFNFVHSASTTRATSEPLLFSIVVASGTGELVGIRGAGGLSLDADGAHRIWFDYELAEPASV